MKTFLFADLDDTLFQTIGKCPGPEGLEPAAWYKDGSVCSYTTRAQRALLALLGDGMTMIPTTARDLDGLRRVDLPFASYAIVNFGGIVLEPGGAVDTGWLDGMRAAMGAALPGLRDLAARIDAHGARTGYGARARLVEDLGIPFFLVVKDPDKDAARLAPLEADVVRPWVDAGGHDYLIHRNGNNLAILPKALDKAHAVAHVTRRLRAEHGAIVTLGMGDSRSDARFMADCDYAIVPRRTQLAGLTMEAL